MAAPASDTSERSEEPMPSSAGGAKCSKEKNRQVRDADWWQLLSSPYLHSDFSRHACRHKRRAQAASTKIAHMNSCCDLGYCGIEIRALSAATPAGTGSRQQAWRMPAWAAAVARLTILIVAVS